MKSVLELLLSIWLVPQSRGKRFQLQIPATEVLNLPLWRVTDGLLDGPKHTTPPRWCSSVPSKAKNK